MFFFHRPRIGLHPQRNLQEISRTNGGGILLITLVDKGEGIAWLHTGDLKVPLRAGFVYRAGGLNRDGNTLESVAVKALHLPRKIILGRDKAWHTEEQ